MCADNRRVIEIKFVISPLKYPLKLFIMLRTVVFDLDGTLLYTLEDLADSVNHALRNHGLPERSLSEIRGFLGNGIRYLMKHAVGEHIDEVEFETVFADFRSHYVEHCTDRTKGGIQSVEALLIQGKMGYAVIGILIFVIFLLAHHDRGVIPQTVASHKGEVVLKSSAAHRNVPSLKFCQSVGASVDKIVNCPLAVMVLQTFVDRRNPD